jgi:glycyl-tRNA synthetase beta chain
VVYLVESPLVLEGSFDERFLDLPERVIVTAMQSHQRYFPLGGALFAFVATGGDPDVVRAGNERVLEGRLDDARFSYERDVQVGIEAMAAQLDSITFHARAGTFADKAVRLRELCDLLGGGEASGEAARLAKADQASTMVHEFPELEGFIGGEYARLAGVPEGVAAAIAEHYLPDQAGGPLPETAAGRVLSAADKIDNLTVAFALGERPTGSRDPHGLRRAAIGLSRLAVDGELEIDLAGLVARDLELLTEQGAEVTDDASDVPEFVLERLEGLLDVPVEFVRAARRSALTELGAVARLARALAAEASSKAFADAYTAFDRANSLAGKASGAAPAIDPGLVAEPAERALLETLAEAGPRIDAAVQARDFGAALEAASELGPPVDRFFDEVHVMAEDEAIRANRLRLLLDVRDAVGALGDLSQIPR